MTALELNVVYGVCALLDDNFVNSFNLLNDTGWLRSRQVIFN